MCAISGWLRYSHDNIDFDKLTRFSQQLASLSSVRGRDSFGIMINSAHGIREQKAIGNNTAFSISPDDRYAISNNRAEPTTEWVENKTTATVQPYMYRGVYAVHNGTIANDKDYDYEHVIDSEVIPYAIATNSFDTLIGSMAIAMVNTTNEEFLVKGHILEKDTIYLYKNYRPTTLVKIPELGLYAFTSLKSTMDELCSQLSLDYVEIDFPHYSLMSVSENGCDLLHRDPAAGTDKGIVVLSGGLDSTTVAKEACLKHDTVYLAHFHYGCRAEERETTAVKEIHKHLKAEFPNKNITLELFDLSFIKNLGGNALTDHTMEVATGEAGAEFAHEWVPFRNGVMVSLIAAYCDRYSIGTIYTGANLEEAGAYGDNEEEFYIHFNKVLQIGSTSRPVIVNPLDKLMKHEIVKLAMDIDAPVHLSWSCYKGGEHHCGDCGPCYLRKKAFKMNGVHDVIKYEK
jgi:7-cyano-7-deazaguanine synthase